MLAYLIVFILFYDRYWQGEVLKLMKNVFRIFSRFGLFPQVFRQVKECLILQLHKMIRVLHAIACSIVFIWFCDRDWQRGVLKLKKNDIF